MKQLQLNPFDVVVALRLISASQTLAEIASDLRASPSQIHTSVKRLEAAGLVRPGSRSSNRRALSEFIEHGVRYAFPAEVGPESIGVPTAHSGPDLVKEIDSNDAFVWPDPHADPPIRGRSLSPLYPRASALKHSSPETYRLLTLVDALRVGQLRERNLATEYLRKALSNAAA